MTVRINKRFVKSILAQRDWTIQDLARNSDIGEATLYRVVNAGARFTSETLEKLSEALDCSPVDLIDTNGYKSPLVHPASANVEYA
jgi:DNA-binding Xre family transcriptional regulator